MAFEAEGSFYRKERSGFCEYQKIHSVLQLDLGCKVVTIYIQPSYTHGSARSTQQHENAHHTLLPFQDLLPQLPFPFPHLLNSVLQLQRSNLQLRVALYQIRPLVFQCSQLSASRFLLSSQLAPHDEQNRRTCLACLSLLTLSTRSLVLSTCFSRRSISFSSKKFSILHEFPPNFCNKDTLAALADWYSIIAAFVLYASCHSSAFSYVVGKLLPYRALSSPFAGALVGREPFETLLYACCSNGESNVSDREGTFEKSDRETERSSSAISWLIRERRPMPQ